MKDNSLAEFIIGTVTRGEVQHEYHEHPAFNGQYHQAQWAYTWVSDSSNDEPSPNAPVICAICGRSYGN